MKTRKEKKPDVRSFASIALSHLESILRKNEKVLETLVSRVVSDVKKGRSLLVFGSGHSAIFPMELYHRAGGASFVIPVAADHLIPLAGPPVVRLFERTAQAANPLLARVEPRKGETLWLASQSGINAAAIDLALYAKKKGLFTVAFTSLPHSRSVTSRHPTGKKLFEVCDEVVDLGIQSGDACVPIAKDLRAGPLSTLTSILLGHSILVSACAELEHEGIRCVYTSVNTPQGESRNRELEEKAKIRDALLRF